MISKNRKATKARVRMPCSPGQIECEPEEVQQRTIREWYAALTAGLTTLPPGPGEELTGESILTLYGLFCAINELTARAAPDRDRAAACCLAEAIGGEMGRRDAA